MAAATVVRSGALPMRSSSASAIDARHVQQRQSGNLTYVTATMSQPTPSLVGSLREAAAKVVRARGGYAGVVQHDE